VRRRRLLIIGAGGHGQVVASVLMNGASAHGGRWDGAELAFLDDTPELAGQTVFGIRVVGFPQ
jgi:FlaA1/EpsC-like NDP-sugar epimerase